MCKCQPNHNYHQHYKAIQPGEMLSLFFHKIYQIYHIRMIDANANLDGFYENIVNLNRCNGTDTGICQQTPRTNCVIIFVICSVRYSKRTYEVRNRKGQKDNTKGQYKRTKRHHVKKEKGKGKKKERKRQEKVKRRKKKKKIRRYPPMLRCNFKESGFGGKNNGRR